CQAHSHVVTALDALKRAPSVGGNRPLQSSNSSLELGTLPFNAFKSRISRALVRARTEGGLLPGESSAEAEASSAGQSEPEETGG
ncbi:hypothetical protein Pmar_PMAR001907, partial [Perkinsus marinus ATCC 50983]